MPKQPYHILLFGPPGAGKSTQGELLRQDWNIVPISTGKLLREQIAAGSQVGLKVRSVLARGELVNDELMDEILRNWLTAIPADKGFLLDGFPRTIPQAQALDGLLAELNRPLTAVINFRLSVSEAVHRLSNRRICYGNGPDEIITINDEEAIARCLERGGLLVQRPDDLPNVIVRRLNVYEAETKPLIEYYQPRGIAHQVDAAGSPEEVRHRIVAAISGL